MREYCHGCTLPRYRGPLLRLHAVEGDVRHVIDVGLIAYPDTLFQLLGLPQSGCQGFPQSLIIDVVIYF